MWGAACAKRRYALSYAVEFMPEHLNLASHFLVALLEGCHKVNSYGSIQFHPLQDKGRQLPLLKISHLLAFMPRSAGSWSLSSSKRSFISLRLFLSASLWDIRSSGEREYGVVPGSFGGLRVVVDDGGAVDGSSAGPAVPACAASRNWREGGRDLERTFLVGPTEGTAFSGTDIRLSGEKDMGDMMGNGRV